MSDTFHAQPLSRFAGPRATIKRPEEIAFFSYDDNHQYRADESGINYFYPPRLPVDLSEGFEKARLFEATEDTHLDDLLRALREKELASGKALEMSVVSWRGMLTKIMCTPFDWLGDWSMFATRYDDVIYIEEDFGHRVGQKETQKKQQRQHDVMSFWGYKFETLALIPDIWANVSRDDIESRPLKVVDNYAQYCSIVQTKIGSTNLILGGEVDGVWDIKPEDPTKPINWIELKTSEEIRDDRGKLKFERKLIRFWAQSFLLGVPKLIVGWRTKAGILTRIEEFQTHRVPGLVRGSTQAWNGNTCINFTAAFLEYLKAMITEGGVWRIWKPANQHLIHVAKVEEEGYGNILPLEYVKHRMAMRSKREQSNGTPSAGVDAPAETAGLEPQV